MENKKNKILVVDDDPDIIEIISYNLKKENYKVFFCYNGTDSIKIAEKENFDQISVFPATPHSSLNVKKMQT